MPASVTAPVAGAPRRGHAQASQGPIGRSAHALRAGPQGWPRTSPPPGGPRPCAIRARATRARPRPQRSHGRGLPPRRQAPGPRWWRRREHGPLRPPPREHARTDLLPVVEGEHEVRPSRPREDEVCPGGPLDDPARPQQGREDLACGGAPPPHQAAVKEMLSRSGPVSPCSSRSATTRSASAWTLAPASVADGP